MNTKRKQKFLVKTTKFSGKEVKLYSMDGIIWSTRQWELEKIQERHDAARVVLDPAEKEEIIAPTEEAKEEPKDDGLDDLVGVVDDLPLPKVVKGKEKDSEKSGKKNSQGSSRKTKTDLKKIKAAAPKARPIGKAAKKMDSGSSKRKRAA